MAALGWWVNLHPLLPWMAVPLLLLRVHSYGSSIHESTRLLPYITQLVGEQRVEQFFGVCRSLIWQQIN